MAIRILEAKIVLGPGGPSGFQASGAPVWHLIASLGSRIWFSRPLDEVMPDVRILVVDDLAPWRQHILAILERRPEFQVVGEASDGSEAVHKAEKLNPDLILLDIGLPTINGIEVQKRLRQLVPSVKVLFLTQNNDADLVQEALRNGTHGYVLKTDAGGELLSGIDSILRGERFVSSGINDLTPPQKRASSSLAHDEISGSVWAKRLRNRLR